MKLFFMEVILANVWCIEDGEEANSHDIAMAAEMLSSDEGKIHWVSKKKLSNVNL
jgi:hypothetical protein